MKWIDFNMSSINILDFLWVVEPYSWKEEMISRKEMVLEFKGRRDTATKNTKKKKSQKHAPIKKTVFGSYSSSFVSTTNKNISLYSLNRIWENITLKV